MLVVELPTNDTEAAALVASRGFTYQFTWNEDGKPNGRRLDRYTKKDDLPVPTFLTVEQVEAMPRLAHLACAPIGKQHYAEFNHEKQELRLVAVTGPGSLRIAPTTLDREATNDLLQFLYDIRDELVP